MLSAWSRLNRIIFLIPILLSVFLGIVSCGTKAAAFTPLTVLSVVGGNVLVQKPGNTNWSQGKKEQYWQPGTRSKQTPAQLLLSHSSMAVLSI